MTSKSAQDILPGRPKFIVSRMSSFEVTGVPIDELQAFLAGAHPDPFRILGPHLMGEDLLVRIFRPDAKEATIVLIGKREQRFPADRLHAAGFFQAVLPGVKRDADYRIHLMDWDGSTAMMRDPYAYGIIMGDVDLHLFSEGNHLQIYEKFGAHLRTVGDASGVYFAVWAPNAQRVSAVGDFNGWDGRVNPMRRLLGSGVWELFLPDVGEGAHYKFEITQRSIAFLALSLPRPEMHFVNADRTGRQFACGTRLHPFLIAPSIAIEIVNKRRRFFPVLIEKRERIGLEQERATGRPDLELVMRAFADIGQK